MSLVETYGRRIRFRCRHVVRRVARSSLTTARVRQGQGWRFDDHGTFLKPGHDQRSVVGASADVAIPLIPLLRIGTPLKAGSKS
jgi:hypothetical protein